MNDIVENAPLPGVVYEGADHEDHEESSIEDDDHSDADSADAGS